MLNNKTYNTPNYRGRFAPTPSGPLHFGSIIAALGSYLQAKSQKGKWLIRIDDVDLSRSVAGADTVILKQLENLGLYWDEEVVYQSKRFDLYQSAIDKLQLLDCTFPCSCSRKDIAGKIYPGTCINKNKSNQPTCSLRIKVGKNEITVKDLLQGVFVQKLDSDVGDFIIKRADNYYAYHLATVVDDAEQNITEVVRGLDLLESTPRQVYLQKKLNLKTPTYLHLPIALDETRKKISKSASSTTKINDNPKMVLIDALQFLGQKIPKELGSCDINSIIIWAIKNWNIKSIPEEKEIPYISK